MIQKKFFFRIDLFHNPIPAPESYFWLKNFASISCYLWIARNFHLVFFLKNLTLRYSKAGYGRGLIFFFLLSVSVPNYSFASSDEVRIRVGIDTCDQDNVCEVLFGENYPACPLDCEAPPLPLTPTSSRRSSSGNRGGGGSDENNNFLNQGGVFFGGKGIEVLSTTEYGFMVSWFDTLSNVYVKLVRSPFNYPKTIFDGKVVYEGFAKFSYDNFSSNVSYYTLFIKQQNNNIFIPAYYFTSPNKVFKKDVLSNVDIYPSKDFVSSKDFSFLEKKGEQGFIDEKMEFSILISQKDKQVRPFSEDYFLIDGLLDTRISIFYQGIFSKDFEYTLDLGTNTSGGTKRIFNFVKGEKRAEIFIPRFLFDGAYPVRIKVTSLKTKKSYFYDFLLKVETNRLPENDCEGVSVLFDKKCENIRSFPLKKYIKILENLLK